MNPVLIVHVSGHVAGWPNTAPGGGWLRVSAYTEPPSLVAAPLVGET
jgi:hypothetical protein